MAFEKTQGYLALMVRYLEGLYTGLEWESEPAAGADSAANPGALPERIAAILTDSGHLEGLHLKSQGILSQELQEFISGIGMAFEMAVAVPGPFKLPFLGIEIALQRKTLNPFMEKAWVVYHGALLSAYAMRPLRFERVSGSQDGLEEVLRITETRPGGGSGSSSAMSPETLHILNNALMGITSYVSLILGERKDDKELQEKLELVLEAARKAADSAQAG